MAILNFPILYAPDPLKGRPLGGGQIYVGEPDLDPEILINQKQLNIIQEDGTIVPVSQPFSLSFGGVPTYNGATVRLDVEGNYSFKLLDKHGAQKYYVENVYEGQVVTTIDLESRYFDQLSTAIANQELSPTGGQEIVLKERSTGNAGGSKWFTVLASTVTVNSYNIVQCTGVGSLALVLNEAKPLPTMFGAIPNINDAPSITQNNGALNAYALYCLDNKVVQDYRGYTYFYDETLDFTASNERNAYAIGDVSDENNVGIYNLVYLGLVAAINCDGFSHDKLGIAGTAKQTDTINPSAVAIIAQESIQHRGSCIRNFDKGYEINGGFYHTFDLGRMNRCRTLWDYTGNPSGIYNSTFNTQNTGFVNGIIANSGDGPVRIGGSWEEWTGRIITPTAGSPQYPIFWENPYIENYPANTVAAGLTGNDADKYTASGIAFSSQSPMKGGVSVVVSGMTTELFRIQNDVDYLDMSISLFGGTVPPSLALFVAQKCTKLELKFDYTNGNFASTVPLTGGANLTLSNGYYNNPDGTISVLDGSSWNAVPLINSWANGAGARILSYRVIDDVIYIQGFLNGASATDVVVGNIPLAIFSRQTAASTWFSTSDSVGTPVQGRIINSSGDFRIETIGLNNIPISISIPLK